MILMKLVELSSEDSSEWYWPSDIDHALLLLGLWPIAVWKLSGSIGCMLSTKEVIGDWKYALNSNNLEPNFDGKVCINLWTMS